MGRESASRRQLLETQQLLSTVRSWEQSAIEALPALYRHQAHKYRRLSKPGEE